VVILEMNWSAEQILALAPDPGSAKAGKDLASLRKWSALGRDDRSAWGECQGSGSKPYQTRIDLSEPAFNCTCPSRKFPCKHSLALFLLLAQQTTAFGDGPPPAWVVEWLATRDKKAAKKAQNVEEPPGELNPEPLRKSLERQQKSANERKAKVDAGLEDLDRWLGDLARRGLASARSEPYSFWEWPAARMVDAQAPGVARLLRELAGVAASGEGWQGRLIEKLGRLHLLIEGYHRLKTLTPEVQADIRQKIEEEDRIKAQRRWLRGESTGRFALVLHFAHASQPLDTSLVPGTVIDAELAFFPAAFPLRALVKNRFETTSEFREIPGSVLEVFEGHAASLAKTPWIERIPVVLGEAVPIVQDGAWLVRDSTGASLPLSPKYARGWTLAALSGGRPIGLFGEWDGDSLTPFSTWIGDRFLPMA
jgi:hypothetical protein